MAFSNRALLASRARLAAFRPQAFSAGAVARFSTYKEDPNQLQSKRKQYMFKTAAEYHHEDTTDHHHHHHEHLLWEEKAMNPWFRYGVMVVGFFVFPYLAYNTVLDLANNKRKEVKE